MVRTFHIVYSTTSLAWELQHQRNIYLHCAKMKDLRMFTYACSSTHVTTTLFFTAFFCRPAKLILRKFSCSPTSPSMYLSTSKKELFFKEHFEKQNFSKSKRFFSKSTSKKIFFSKSTSKKEFVSKSTSKKRFVSKAFDNNGHLTDSWIVATLGRYSKLPLE